MQKRQSRRARVFLNLPYDAQFQNLYFAYLASVCAFGMYPRVTLEIPGPTRRLDRIFQLIQRCEYSIHDLSRVQLDPSEPRTPRFNMPFELGLAVAWARTAGRGQHIWFAMESAPYRLAKSLSDLNGTDPYVHDGTIEGIFREMGNAFVRPGLQPSVKQMWAIYREMKRKLPGILSHSGAHSVFEARVFRELSVTASAIAGAVIR